jgi:predicted metalloprotease with PDZ domain
MAPGIRLRDPQGSNLVKRLLAHELFHNWNGGIIVVRQPEILHYWFSEGFTNFYTRRLLYRAGLVSLEETLERLNDVLSRYMLSPARNVSNLGTLANFWKDKNVHELPYLRGDLVAIMTDHAIREASQGKQSLDDLMRDLLARAKEGRVVMDNKTLVATIGRYTSPVFAERIRKIIEYGETAELAADTFAPCLKLKTEHLGPFDLGFDFERSTRHRRVVGVRPGSRAHRAGLKDGHRMAGWDVQKDQIRREVVLVVVENDVPQTITYLPQGEQTDVPQFVSGKSPRACPEHL